MESVSLSDAESQQMKDEFKDPSTSVNRRKEVAKILLSALSDLKKKLWRRFQNGEQLSDRELALLAYDENVNENVWKQIMERKLSETLRDQYIQEYVATRVTKQLANQASKEGYCISLIAYNFGWKELKELIKTDHKFTLGRLLRPGTWSLSNPYWFINFAAAGVSFMYDLSHSLYLYFDEKISGQQVIKRMTCSIASNGLAIAGSHLGLAIGATIGFFIGPLGGFVGSIIGGAIGGVTFSLLGTFLNEAIWRYFEKEDKDQALEELSSKARETLGVTKADDFQTVTRKWRVKVLEYHPDKHPNATEEERRIFSTKFQEVHLSYQILRKNEEKRNRISKTEIDKISKTDPIFIVQQDGWADDDNEII